MWCGSRLVQYRWGRHNAVSTSGFDKLTTSLRTAVDNEGSLDKEATSYNDILTHIG